MPIRYRIIRSKLPANPDGYVAQVQPRRTVTLDEIAEEISLRGTSASKPDILSILMHFGDIMEKFLARGDLVQTPIGTFYVVIQGTFTDGSDTFDPSRHRLAVRVIPCRRLVEAVNESRPERYVSARTAPNPVCYIDIATGDRDRRITPHNQGRLIGKDLQFDPTDPRQGVFFVAADNAETQVRSVAINKPRQIILLAPDLVPGAYRLVVRNAAEKSGELHSGELGVTLQVV